MTKNERRVALAGLRYAVKAITGEEGFVIAAFSCRPTAVAFLDRCLTDEAGDADSYAVLDMNKGPIQC